MPQDRAILTLLAAACLAFVAPTQALRGLQQEPTTTDIKICIPEDLGNVPACNDAVALASDQYAGITFSCLSGGTVAGCLRQVSLGASQLAKVPASGVWLGDKDFGLTPLVSEFFNTDVGRFTQGYAVAAIPNDACYVTAAGVTLTDYAKKTACFAGYRSDGAWQVPVGTLINRHGMAILNNATDYTDDAESVARFFDEVCAPGKYPYYPRIDGNKGSKICGLCDDATHSCDTDDPWYGTGVSKCKGDILFMQLPQLGTMPIKAPKPPGAPASAATDGGDGDATPPVVGPKAEAPSAGGIQIPGLAGAALPDDSSEDDYKTGAGSPEGDYEGDIPPAKAPNKAPKASPSPKKEAPARRRRRSLLQDSPELDPKIAAMSLICGSGDQKCRPATEFASCNLGRVPSQAFVASKEFASSGQGALVQQALVKASANEQFLTKSADVGSVPFVLVSNGVTSLSAVDVSVSEYLGPEFSAAMEGFNKADLGVAMVDGSKSGDGGDSGGGGGSSLSTTTIIVIAVVSVVVVGGLVTAGLVYNAHRKKKAGWAKYQDAVKEIQRI